MRTFTRDSTHLRNPTDEQHCSLQPTSTAFLLFVVLPVQGRKAVFSQCQGILGKQTTANCLRDDSLEFIVSAHVG